MIQGAQGVHTSGGRPLHLSDTSPQYNDLSLLRVETWLRDHVLTSSHHPSQSLVTLRGIQAGFFQREVLLRWRRSLLPHAPEAHLPTRLTDDVASRLRTLCSPDTAAALVIQLHLAADPSSMTIGQLSADGATFTQNAYQYGRQVPVQHRLPRSAHSILAAHLAQRRGPGVGDDSPLFSRVPPTPGHQALRLRFGVPRLDAPSLAARPATPEAHTTPWLSERGLSLYKLDTHAITGWRS